MAATRDPPPAVPRAEKMDGRCDRRQTGPLGRLNRWHSSRTDPCAFR